VLEVHFLELPSLRETVLSGKTGDPLVQWMLFVDGESQEVIKMLAQDNKVLFRSAPPGPGRARGQAPETGVRE